MRCEGVRRWRKSARAEPLAVAPKTTRCTAASPQPKVGPMPIAKTGATKNSSKMNENSTVPRSDSAKRLALNSTATNRQEAKKKTDYAAEQAVARHATPNRRNNFNPNI